MCGRWRFVKWVVVFILASCLATWMARGRAYSAGPSLAAAPVLPERPMRDEVLMIDAHFVLTVVPLGDSLVYLGVSENIVDEVNPDLVVDEGDIVELTLLSIANEPIDIAILGYGVSTPVLTDEGTGASVIFEAAESGEFTYCGLQPGLADRGLLGHFRVKARDEIRVPAPAEIISGK